MSSNFVIKKPFYDTFNAVREIAYEEEVSQKKTEQP